MQNDELESRLKKLSPVDVRLDPFAAAYAAGKQNADRAINRSRGLAVLAILVAVVPWVMPREKQVALTLPQTAFAPPAPVVGPPIEAIESNPSGNLWQLREAVLEKGLDGIPRIPIPHFTAADTGIF